MGFPISFVKCTHCDYEFHPILGLGTASVYEYQDVLVHIPRESAWCHDCKNIVTAESLEPEETSVVSAEFFFRELAYLKERYAKAIPEDNTIPLESTQGEETEGLEGGGENWGEMDRFFEQMRAHKEERLSRLSADDASRLFQVVSDLEKIERDAQSLLSPIFFRELLKERSSKPKCLKCGSTNFTKLAIQDKESIEEQAAARHPGCGGILYWKETGDLVELRDEPSSVKFYDTEGNYIRTENK